MLLYDLDRWIISAFVGIILLSVPGACEEPGYSCGDAWVPAGLFFLLVAVGLIFAGCYVGTRSGR